MTAPRPSRSRTTMPVYGGSSYAAFAKTASKLPLLTREEEVELAIASQRGCGQARERLIISNIRLVMSIVGKMSKKGSEEADDLFSYGIEGLIQAISKFDPSKGFKISTYASWWIKQSIVRNIEVTTFEIALPVHVQSFFKRVQKADMELPRILGRRPTEEEVAEWCCITPKYLKKVRNLPHASASLDDPMGPDDGSVTRKDIIAGEDDMDPEMQMLLTDRQEQLYDAMQVLPERAQKVLKYYFMENLSFTEIGAMSDISLTRERVRQIYNKALRVLAAELTKNEEPRPQLPIHSMLPPRALSDEQQDTNTEPATPKVKSVRKKFKENVFEALDNAS